MGRGVMNPELGIELFGIKLQSPFILGSGPISYGAAGMIRAHLAGFGAVVTKTIRDKAAVNPYPHIAASGRDTLVNAEKWADFPAEQFVKQEIPRAKQAGAVVIGSIGHTPEEAEHWVQAVDQAGADIIELVSYTEDTIVAMTKAAKRLTHKPVLVKMSPNWPDALVAVREALAQGADGVTAMDSIGPVLRIDIKTAGPLLGGERGMGWLTGAAIKPIALRYVADIARLTNKPIIGLGGVMNAADSVEMLMAGASAVGVCTAAVLKGVEYVGRLSRDLAKLLGDLGYETVPQVSRAALPNLHPAEVGEGFGFAFDQDTCTSCKACVKGCPYDALSLSRDKELHRSQDICRLCGLCITLCKFGALRAV